MKQQVKRREKFGVFFWLAVIALAAIVILVNRGNIRNTLQQSDIKQALNNRVQSSDIEQSLSNGATAQREEGGNSNRDPSTVQDSIITPLVDALISDKNTSTVLDNIETIVNDSSEKIDSLIAVEDAIELTEQLDDGIETGVAHIYFVKVSSEGHITPQVVARTVPKTTAPLTQSINILLQGLTTDEVETGLLHLIPPQTELLSATIQDGVAILDFTEHFRYNGYGEEGMIAQMLQVVYSVTQFSTINAVQILIEGESIDFLNSDSSIYVGKPVNRESITFS